MLWIGSRGVHGIGELSYGGVCSGSIGLESRGAVSLVADWQYRKGVSRNVELRPGAARFGSRGGAR